MLTGYLMILGNHNVFCVMIVSLSFRGTYRNFYGWEDLKCDMGIKTIRIIQGDEGR